MEKQSLNVVWHNAVIQRKHRESENGHKSAVVWFTGLSGAGKSTIAHSVEQQLHRLKARTYVLDGDNLRHGLCGDLGFSREDRAENIRRIGEVAKLFVDAGTIVLTAFISPFRADRERVRGLVMHGDFLEVFCKCPIELCEQRDIKGIYKRARAGEIGEFTGISSPYEEPISPELVVDTSILDVESCTSAVVSLLRSRAILSPP
jgi:adenylylsulfate kinase